MRYFSVGLKLESAGMCKEDEGRRLPFKSCFPCVLALIILYHGNSDKYHITPLARSQVVNALWLVP